MNVNSIAQVSTVMASEGSEAQVEVAVAKLANNNAELQGQAAVQLIQSVPQPQGNVGNNINVKV